MNNKKILTIVGVSLLVILLIIGCLVGGGENGTSTVLSNDPQTIMVNAQKESEEAKKGKQPELNEINVDTYLDYYKDSEETLILVARPTCGYCQVAEPIIKKIVNDYKATIYYLNTDNFEGEDTAKFTSSDEKFSSGFGTPMLLVVGNGKIIDMVDGLTDTAHYIDFLKNNNFIK